MTDAPSEATRVALRRALHDARPLPPARPPTARVLALRAVLVAAKLGVVVAVPTTIVAILGAGFYVRAVLEIRVPGLALASWSAVVAVLWACYHAWKGQRSAAHHGVLVAPREAPQLFALLSDVARVAETEPPDEVLVEWGGRFAVEDLDERDERGRPRRRLHLPPANVAGLTLAEVTSILVHEAGHFRGGHTALSARLFRGARRLFHLEWLLRRQKGWWANPVWWVATLASRAYHVLYGSISRTQEREADELAFELVGGASFASGLEKVHVAGLRERAFGGRALAAYADAAPGSDCAVFDAIASAEIDERELREHLDRALARPQQRGDTHPPSGERIRAAREYDARHARNHDDALHGGGDPWRAFFGDGLERLQRQVVDRFLGTVREEHRAAIGLRGPWLGEEESAAATLSLDVPAGPRLASVGTLVTAFFAMLFAGTILIVADASERVLAAPFALAAVALGLHGFRGVWRRFRADDLGFSCRGLFGTKRASWTDVASVRITERAVRLRTTGGGRVAIAPVGTNHALVTDLVLERVPALAVVGWGSGLARIPRPPDAATRPTLVRTDDGVVTIEGPGDASVAFTRRHPNFDTIRAFVADRLVEWVNAGRRPKKWRDADPVDGGGAGGARG